MVETRHHSKAQAVAKRAFTTVHDSDISNMTQSVYQGCPPALTHQPLKLGPGVPTSHWDLLCIPNMGGAASPQTWGVLPHLKHGGCCLISNMGGAASPQTWGVLPHLKHGGCCLTSNMGGAASPQTWGVLPHLKHGGCCLTSNMGGAASPQTWGVLPHLKQTE